MTDPVMQQPIRIIFLWVYYAGAGVSVCLFVY